MRLIIERDGYNPFYTIRRTVDSECRAASKFWICKMFCRATLARLEALVALIKAIVVIPFVCLAATFKMISGVYTCIFALLNCKKEKLKESCPEFGWALKTLLATILVIAMSCLSIALPEVMIKGIRIYRCSKFIYIPWCDKRHAELDRNMVPKIKGFTITKQNDKIFVEDKQIPNNDQVISFLHSKTKQRYKMYLEG